MGKPRSMVYHGHVVRVLVVALGLGAAGCSSGAQRTAAGTIPAAPVASPIASPAAAATTKPVPSGPPVTITLSIRKPSTVAASGRRPKYVPPATQSVVFTATPTVGQPVTATANCTSSLCTTSLAVPSGGETFVAQLFDGASGTGHLLAAGRATATIAVAQANVVPLLASPVFDSMTASISPSTLPAGAPATSFLSIVPLDQAGNVIGAGAMVDTQGHLVTVALTHSRNAPTVVAPSTAGSVSLASSSLTDAGAMAYVRASYDGGGLFSDGITATATNGSSTLWTASAQLTLTPTLYEYANIPLARDGQIGPDGNIWIAQYDNGYNQISTFAPPAPGATTLTPTVYNGISGNAPLGLAFSSDGQLWWTTWTGTIVRCPPPPTLSATNAGSVCTVIPTLHPDHSDKILDSGFGTMIEVESYYDSSYVSYTATSAADFTNLGGTGGQSYLTRSSDGKLWSIGGQTSCCGHPKVVSIDPGAGYALTSFSVPFGETNGMATGKDGNNWVILDAQNQVANFSESATPGTASWTMYNLPSVNSGADAIAAAGDGVYVSETNVSRIVRIPYTVSSTADMTEWVTSGKPYDIFLGPDGNIYATLDNNKLAKIAL